MDAATRSLQSELISFIKSCSSVGSWYDLPNQLLSVQFHEEWVIDPVTLQISKKVRGITPVIWQRRRTEAGESINDADTGLPVYYKNQLPPIQLRNP